MAETNPRILHNMRTNRLIQIRQLIDEAIEDGPTVAVESELIDARAHIFVAIARVTA